MQARRKPRERPCADSVADSGAHDDTLGEIFKDIGGQIPFAVYDDPSHPYFGHKDGIRRRIFDLDALDAFIRDPGGLNLPGEGIAPVATPEPCKGGFAVGPGGVPRLPP